MAAQAQRAVIVTAVDGRSGTAAVLDRAARLAAGLRASLAVVHVVRATPALFPEVRLPDLADEVSADLFPDVVEALADCAVPWSLHILEGDPARQIMRAARGTGASLIVVGAHERAGLIPKRRGRCTVQQLMGSPGIPLLVIPHGGTAATSEHDLLSV